MGGAHGALGGGCTARARTGAQQQQQQPRGAHQQQPQSGMLKWLFNPQWRVQPTGGGGGGGAWAAPPGGGGGYGQLPLGMAFSHNGKRPTSPADAHRV